MTISFRTGVMSLAVAALLSTPALADGSKLDEVLARGQLDRRHRQHQCALALQGRDGKLAGL